MNDPARFRLKARTAPGRSRKGPDHSCPECGGASRKNRILGGHDRVCKSCGHRWSSEAASGSSDDDLPPEAA